MTDIHVDKALYLTSVGDLEHLDNGYSRLYYGSEFCQRLIPSEKDLSEVLDLASANDLGFTFLTPYVTNDGLRTLEFLLGKIAREKPGSEVVFNDWGVLELIKDKQETLIAVMGRMLNKMKRGPRLMRFLDMLPTETVEYYRNCNLGVPAYQYFLIRNRIRRVELDNLLQGMDVDLGQSGIHASLYVPYAFVTTTRFCPAISCDVPGREDEIGIFPCRQECRRYCFTLTHPVMAVPLISKGNTKFFRNEKLPEDLERNHVDRLVYEPEVPV